MGRASSSARTATASPGGPTRARRPVWTMDSTVPVPRASATRPEVACSSWLRSGIACSRSRSPRARGSSSSRESRSFRRRSVDTQVPLAGLLRIHTFEEGDLGPLDSQVAVEEVLREPGADNRVGLERVEGCPERVRERTDAQAVSFSLDEPLGLEREAWPRLQGRATQHKLLLEGGDQAQPGLLFKPGQRVLEEGARAGIPRAPVGVGRVAEEEVQGRDFIPK